MTDINPHNQGSGNQVEECTKLGSRQCLLEDTTMTIGKYLEETSKPATNLDAQDI